MTNARTTALSALIAARRQGAWSDGALKEYISRDRLERRDAALASRLCYGVLQNRMLLDYYIEVRLTGKLKDLQPVVLDILRLGAYQILFMDRIPDSAAVNEAVEQTKTYANKRASGLVNGVLRALIRARDEITPPSDLSVRYSHPAKLVELLRDAVGEEQLESLLQANNAPTPTVLQINPLKANEAEVLEELTQQGITLTPHPWLGGCYLAEATGNLEKLDAFASGRVYVQDPAAKLAAMAAELKPGMRVLDACAAPGGKSFAAAMQMENRGSILSCDIHPHKISIIEKGAQRLGIDIISARVQSAAEFCPEFENAFDAVIADVPCSGLGVIRKKPDIRYKDLAPLANLPQIQSAILENVSRYLKPGGVLLYSTCTVLPRENEAVVKTFLAAHPEFSAEPVRVPNGLHLADDTFVTLWPHLHESDGFFICKLRKHP